MAWESTNVPINSQEAYELAAKGRINLVFSSELLNILLLLLKYSKDESFWKREDNAESKKKSNQN